MDPKAAFAFAIIATGFGGLFALASGNLAIVNGQIIIGKSNVAAASNPASATAPVAGATSTLPDTGSGGFGTINPGAPTLSGGSAINQIIGATTSNTTLGSIYDPTQTLALISSIAGDGAAVNPYGVGVPS